MSVRVGMTAPEFELRTQRYRLLRLLDLRGSFVVIYFYPGNAEPESVTESCLFRKHHDEFQDMDTVVVGVSDDSQGSHIEFSEKWNIPFPLLADIGGRLRKEWGVPNVLSRQRGPRSSFARSRYSANRPGRVTYVLDKEGVVRHIIQSATQPKKHVLDSLNAIRRLRRS